MMGDRPSDRVVFRQLGVPVAMALVVLFVVLPQEQALAGCPPIDFQGTVLDFLERVQSGALSDEQLDVLVRQGRVKGAPFAVAPSRGPAPLMVWVGFWAPQWVPEVVELDMDGDGALDTLTAQRTYTYQRPGRYTATARAYDRDGPKLDYTRAVTVLTMAAFDAELKERWASLKETIRRGDLEAAIHCLHAKFRHLYRERLMALDPERVDRDFHPIRFKEFHEGIAIYQRVGPGVDRDADTPWVRFRPDFDGVWRIQSF